jgi:hypothetical protein
MSKIDTRSAGDGLAPSPAGAGAEQSRIPPTTDYTGVQTTDDRRAEHEQLRSRSSDARDGTISLKVALVVAFASSHASFLPRGALLWLACGHQQ